MGAGDSFNPAPDLKLHYIVLKQRQAKPSTSVAGSADKRK
jgi:hypothetical protein